MWNSAVGGRNPKSAQCHRGTAPVSLSSWSVRVPTPVGGATLPPALGSAQGKRYRVLVPAGAAWAEWGLAVQRQLRLAEAPAEMEAEGNGAGPSWLGRAATTLMVRV